MAVRAKRGLAGDRACRIVAERGRDLRPQQIERVFAYPVHRSLDLSVARVRRLRGEDDQQPQEVRVALERADDGRHRAALVAALSQILGRGPSARTEPAGSVAEESAAQR